MEHPAEGSLDCAAELEVRLLPSSPKPREGTPRGNRPPALPWGWVVGTELVQDPPKPFTGEKWGDRAWTGDVRGGGWSCVHLAGTQHVAQHQVQTCRGRSALVTGILSAEREPKSLCEIYTTNTGLAAAAVHRLCPTPGSDHYFNELQHLVKRSTEKIILNNCEKKPFISIMSMFWIEGGKKRLQQYDFSCRATKWQVAH